MLVTLTIYALWLLRRPSRRLIAQSSCRYACACCSGNAYTRERLLAHTVPAHQAAHGYLAQGCYSLRTPIISAQVAEQLSWLEESAVRNKLLPLLMQWDLCHPNQVNPTNLFQCRQHGADYPQHGRNSILCMLCR